MTTERYIRGHFLDNAILAIGRAALRLEGRLGRELAAAEIQNLGLQVQFAYRLVESGNIVDHLQFAHEVLKGVEFLRARHTNQIRHVGYHDFQSAEGREQSIFYEGAAILDEIDSDLSDELDRIRRQSAEEIG